MAERRMFAKTIVLSDAFLDMPATARCLYFTMAMMADDDGFVNNPKSIMRQSGATEDDARILISKKFVIPFESGVIVIKHWRIHNWIRGDRSHPTKYADEMAHLHLDDNMAYSFDGDRQLSDTCQPDDSQLSDTCHTEVRLGKVRLGKDRLGKDRLVNNTDGKMPPTLEDVTAYCAERSNGIDPQSFIDYYAQQGWKLSNGNKMKDWKAAVRNWEARDRSRSGKQKNKRSYGCGPVSAEDNNKALRQMEALMKEMREEQ